MSQMKSYAPQVRANVGDPKFYGNALRFATHEEAEANVRDLERRWLLVIETRVVESGDAPNYTFIDGTLESIKPV